MKTIKEKIKEDFMVAFKAKEMSKKNFLGLIKSTIENEEKNKMGELNDSEVTKILEKFQKSLNEVITKGVGDTVVDAKFELSILEGYLPKKMSEDEIRNKILELKNGGANNIGMFMSAFKDLPADKTIVSKIVKEVL